MRSTPFRRQPRTKGTAKTHLTAQAGIWFSQSVFDMIAHRYEDSDVQFARAPPDFPR